MSETSYKKIIDIHCPTCGGVSDFDIVKQRYHCAFCGGDLEISEALKEKQGFRMLQAEKLRESLKRYKLFHAVCEGCGADVVFEEGEAVSKCAFCGRDMVRKEYLSSKDMPESVIPFAITRDEAKDLLQKWCRQNMNKPEARRLRGMIDELNGFYLPYELIRGPVHMRAGRMDGYRKYECEGFVHDAFINRSKQLDNLLLDGMEPYDIDELKGFDFGYIAGQKVKIADAGDKELRDRAVAECEKTYRPSVSKVLESKAVEVDADISDAISLPVLLPVYYICDDDLMAAVNGQSGKVSVRALKASNYYFLPWWFKALIASILICLIVFGALRFFGVGVAESFYILLILGFFYLIVVLCLYSDTVHNRFRVESGKKVYSSGEKTFVRRDGQLEFSDEILERKVEEPVFFEKIDGTYEPVVLSFTSFPRVLKMALLALLALFLPVLIALLLNGFQWDRINLGGSAVWFCIMVPVVPIYLLKFGVVELHDDPWIYRYKKNGKLSRYRKKFGLKFDKHVLGAVLRALFVPPVSLAVWFGILSFIVICYLTAGFE
jgi:hypothetical protein